MIEVIGVGNFSAARLGLGSPGCCFRRYRRRRYRRADHLASCASARLALRGAVFRLTGEAAVVKSRLGQERSSEPSEVVAYSAAPPGGV